MSIFLPEVPVPEKIIRSAIVYLFLFLAFRLAGKRQIGQMSPFDLIVLLVISNVLQNAMIGKDDSVLGGLIGATTVLVLNYGAAWLSIRSHRMERVLEGEPTLLVHNGRILERNLRKELITPGELMAAIRRGGLENPRQVHLAILEETGAISIIPMHPAS